MDRRLLLLPAGAAAVWYAWTHRGRTHTVTVDQRATAPDAYQAYAHWWHQQPGGWVRHYPDSIGPLCLGKVLSAQMGSLSTTALQEPGYADAC